MVEYLYKATLLYITNMCGLVQLDPINLQCQALVADLAVSVNCFVFIALVCPLLFLNIVSVNDTYYIYRVFVP